MGMGLGGNSNKTIKHLLHIFVPKALVWGALPLCPLAHSTRDCPGRRSEGTNLRPEPGLWVSVSTLTSGVTFKKLLSSLCLDFLIWEMGILRRVAGRIQLVIVECLEYNEHSVRTLLLPPGTAASFPKYAHCGKHRWQDPFRAGVWDQPQEQSETAVSTKKL